MTGPGGLQPSPNINGKTHCNCSTYIFYLLISLSNSKLKDATWYDQLHSIIMRLIHASLGPSRSNSQPPIMQSSPGISYDTSLHNQLMFTTTIPLAAMDEADDDEAQYWAGLDETPYVNADLSNMSWSPPAIVIPHCYSEQPPSFTGMLAYTLFGGPEQGVFYNWCEPFPFSQYISEGIF